MFLVRLEEFPLESTQVAVSHRSITSRLNMGTPLVFTRSLAFAKNLLK